MAKVRIYLEGQSDEAFINQYLNHLDFVLNDDLVVENLGGKDNLKAKVKADFLDNYSSKLSGSKALGYKNVVVFDADDDFDGRLNELTALKAKFEFELFLFPNDKDNGNLETLLCEIVNPKHKKILECFDGFRDCISVNPDYRLPDDKTKMYVYVDTLVENKWSDGRDIAHPKNRNYQNPDHWNLNHEYLTPLKTFLQNHIQ